MANVDTLRDKIAAVSDSVRRRTGMTNDISLDDLPSYIRGISGKLDHVEVASIISDGKSWINTNICPNANYSIEMRFRMTQCIEGQYDNLFGCRYSYTNSYGTTTGRDSYAAWFDAFDDCILWFGISSGRNNDRLFYDATDHTKYNTMDTFKTLRLINGIIYINNEMLKSFGTSNGKHQFSYPLYLMSCNADDILSENSVDNAHMEMLYCKLWDDDGELILDLVPVLKSNGVVCLYNKVNSSYLYNQGTGTFRCTMSSVSTVTYHIDGDTYTEDCSYGYSCLNPTSFEIPEKEGYTFLGWAESENSDAALDSLQATVNNIHLYAVWEESEPSYDAEDVYIINPYGTSQDTIYLQTDGTPNGVYNIYGDTGMIMSRRIDDPTSEFIYSLGFAYDKQGGSYLTSPIDCLNYRSLTVQYVTYDAGYENYMAEIFLASHIDEYGENMTIDYINTISVAKDGYTPSSYTFTKDLSSDEWQTVTIDVTDIDRFYLGFRVWGNMYIGAVMLTNIVDDDEEV